jgi:outer membrane autotransporter protein
MAVRGQEVKLGDINGSGGTVNMLTSSDLKTAKLSIGTIESDAVNKIDLKAKAVADPKLTINYTGITADDLNNVADDLGGLAKNISVAEGTNTGLTATANVAEGLLKGSVSADLDTTASGSTVKVDSVKQNKESSTMTSMRNIASVAIVSWRQEDSTLSQRLGELRSSEGDQGIWARMSRGEFEYSGAYKNQYNFFQLGYDKAFGSWHYGAAISHNDGKTTYDSGKGENKSTSLSLYGTWLGDRGHYTDIVLKQGRLSNEYDNYAAAGHTHGYYDAWGTSLSGEYGMKVGLDNGWYVTPQAQLTLMRIGGEDYTTNNGIKVNQDTLESCVGRVGFEMGKTISDKGSIYAKASLLHEFAGNADTYLSLNSISNSYSQDIGGTWYEAGLGFNFKTTDNSYVYADVVKTFGDDIKTPWQWNVGARWSF